ncbi:unnamed protein product [Clavelina lepadiformis]|uniref:Vitellogenin n=1 Tax=Clavelina lepadiformis TaxID=159417 RepID=A0ABP0GAW6_CLALP
MEVQALLISLLLLAIVSKSESRVLDTSFQCSSTCEDPVNFQFNPGFTYQYHYSASVVSSFHDAATEGQRSLINLAATVLVDVVTPCEHILRIQEASIRDSQNRAVNAQDWADDLQRNPVHFNWQDGSIPEICSSNSDPAWVLNIKRGVLSTLQVSSVESTEAIEETDVTGTCESAYEVEETDGNIVITKTKDYSKCEDREKYLLFSHFTPYHSDSPRQSFIHSKQSCHQMLVGGQIQSTTCDEEHTFRPFSNEESGAKTTIRQTMNAAGRQRYFSGDTLLSYNVRRTSLAFENENNPMTPSGDISELQDLFSNICVTMSGENYEQVGADFIKMVFLLRRLDAPALQQAYSSLNGACPTWENALKGMFQDALQWCGSEECVVFETRLIKQGPKVLPDETASRWLTGMSLIAEPTLPMLDGIKNVLRSGRLTEKAHLTTGTMIHRLCKAPKSNCLTEPRVVRALEVFEDKLGVNCRTTNPEQKQDILLALRALGNAGRSSAINVLAACAQETTNDMETRVAAVEAFRRMPCNTDRTSLSGMTLDIDQDAEIRIASYMAVMHCPTPQFIQQMTAMLDNEPVQQVASFISTHFQQLLESTDPLKGYIKPLLVETNFAKKYNLDPRKYSRFYEASFFSETLNSGATVESSVVWSPKSFVPRSADLDLNVDVFGQAVNLLEMGGRVEGVETFIQSMMQSELLKNNPLSELFMAQDDDDTDSDDNEEVVARSSREADGARIIEVQRQYKNGLNREDKPNANWYLRLFGNEMFYGNTRSVQPSAAEEPPMNIIPILTRLAQGGEYHYHDDTMLVNSAHVLPTGVGLPLTIAFNGSASVDIAAEGKLDMTGLFLSPPNLAVLGSLKPRAVVLVTGSMSVDAHATRTGIATQSSAVTSMTVGGKMTIDNGRRVLIKIDAPFERNTLFSFNHKLMKINGDEMTYIGEEQSGSKSRCSVDYAGQRVCLDVPNNLAIFPVDGPMSISAYMEKTDSGFDHYLLDGTYHAHHDEDDEGEEGGLLPPEFHGSIRMDTPGSSVDRETNIGFMYSVPNMRFVFSMRCPNDNMRLEGNVESEPMRKHVSWTYVRNGDTTSYEGVLEQRQDGTETEWSATTTFQMPSKTISGSAIATLDPSDKIALNISLTNILPTPIVLDISMHDRSDKQRNRFYYSGNSQIKLPGFVDTSLRFDMNAKPKTDSFAFSLHYEFDGGEEQHLHFFNKRRNRSTATVTNWDVEQSFVFSPYPRFNHHIQLAHTNRAGSVSSYVMFKYGKHATHGDNRRFIMVNQTLDYSTESRTEVAGHFDMQVPQFRMSHQANLHHVHSANMINSKLTVGTYGLRFFVQDNTPANGLVDKELRVEIPTPWGDLRAHDTIQETQKDVYVIEGQFGIGRSQGLEMSGRWEIENLSNRKSLTIDMTGNDEQNLLNSRHVFEYLQPSGFNIENSIEWKYNRLIRLNLRHEGAKQGGFETEFLLENVPDKLIKLDIDFENENDHQKRFVRFDFVDASGTRRYMKIEGNRAKIMLESGKTQHTADIEFVCDVPQIPVHNFLANAQFASSSTTYDLRGAITYNDVEVTGASGSYEYEARRDNSAVTVVSVNLRQQKFPYLPEDVTLTANVQNTLRQGHVVTLTYEQDGETMTTGRFDINQDNTRVSGDVTQSFSETVARTIQVEVTKLENGLIVEVTPDGSPASLRVEKSDNNVLTATWSNRNEILTSFNVPDSVMATLRWGTRSRDYGKGIWLTAEIDRAQLTSELMYYGGDQHIVSASLQHEVEALLDGLPRISFRASAQNSLSAGDNSYVIRINDEVYEDFRFTYDVESGFDCHFQHKCEYLDTVGMPKNTTLNFQRSRGTNPTITLTVNFDDSITLNLEKDEDSVRLNYQSIWEKLPGQIDVMLRKPSEQNSIDLQLNLNGEEKAASISYYFDCEGGVYAVHISQTLYRDVNCPYIPNVASLEIRIPKGTFAVDSTFNDYHFATSYEIDWVPEDNKMILDYHQTQNIFDMENFDAHEEYQFHPTEFIHTKTWHKNNGPERSMMTRLAYIKDDATNSKELNAVFTHNDPEILERLGIPEDQKFVASITNLENGFKGSFYFTVNEGMRKITLTSGVDTDQNALRLSMSHDIELLTELGVYRNITLHVHGLPREGRRENTIKVGGWAQIDDKKYSVDLDATYEIQEDRPEINFDTTFCHNIDQLYNLGVPFTTTADASVVYAVFDGELTGGSSISCTLTRTIRDDETGENVDIVNHAEVSVDLHLFSYNAIFAGSHDFDVTFLPNNVKYEVAFSGSTTSSHVFYKSFSMAVTLDGKTQVATVTVNRNPTDDSFSWAMTHNVTQILKYGVPGTMSIVFRVLDNYNADLSIVYDTSKKSIGFKLDYMGNDNKLMFYINHNFDMVVEQLGVPKNLGFEASATKNNHEADVELRYVWGPKINTAHATMDWEWDQSSILTSFSYRHHQNITSNDIFPRKTRLRWTCTYDNRGLTARLTADRKYLHVEFYKEESGEGTPFAGTASIKQNLEQDVLPRNVRVDATVRKEEPTSRRIDLTVSCDRDVKLESTITASFNMEEQSASLRIQNTQTFVESDVFSTSFDSYGNVSLTDSFTTYVRFEHDDNVPFVMGLKAGLDLEEKSGFVEMNHAQQAWKREYMIPKKIRVEASYLSNDEENQKSVTIGIGRGRTRNEITMGTGYRLTDDSVYGRLSYTHDLEELQSKIPMSGTGNILLAKGSESLTAQANVTLDTVALIHNVEAIYSLENTEVSVSFEASQDNVYLEPYNVPHTVAFTTSAVWENNAVGNLRTTYGDKTTSLRLSTDWENTAELHFSHSWPQTPHDVQIVLSGSRNDQQATLSLSIDGIEKDIYLSGNLDEGEGDLHFSHGFEGTIIPADVILRGSYRSNPDMHLAVHATIDGLEHSLSGGFNKLEDGFHITSTLLDDVSRSATFRQNLIPGGFSVELEHNIPELINYVPGSVGVAASARLNPRPNITASVRQQANTQSFTAETDLNALRFALSHDFEILPLPRSVSLELSGTRSPLEGSVVLEIDGTRRMARGSVDPHNMVASIMHEIPEIPLPGSVRIEANKTASPPGGSISVTIDGLERSLSAEMDINRMRGRIQHGIPEMDQLFVPRDIIVGLKATSDPISGEVYVSLDGLERRVRASFSPRRRVLSFLHNIPDVTYVPRNVTLSAKGNMEPLSGSISLTIDEVERNIGAEVDSRSLFAALTHRIPEMDPYVPRHLSVSAGFTTSSAQVSVSFEKNGVNKQVTTAVNFNPNHLRLQVSQDVDTEYSLPEEFAMDLTGDIQTMNFTFSFNADSTFANVNGEVMTGENGWYGASLEAQHNIKAARKSLRMLKNLEIALKGRKDGNSYEGQTVLKFLRKHDYSAVASITPTLNKKRVGLTAEYDHTYNERQRSVSGSINAVSRNNEKRLMADFVQTEPERKEFHFTSTVSSEVGDQYEFTFGVDTSHNMEELTACGVPSRVENGQITLMILPADKTVRGEANADIDGTSHAYSFDVRATTAGGYFTLNGDVVFDNGDRNEAYSGEVRAHYTFDEEPLRLSASVNVVDRNSGLGTRNDLIQISVLLNSAYPRLNVHIDQPELNQLGVPVDTRMSIDLKQTSLDDIDLKFLVTIDGRDFVVTTVYHHTAEPLYEKLELALDQAVSDLYTAVPLPKHLALAGVLEASGPSNSLDIDFHTRLEYNDYKVMNNFTESVSSTQGSVSTDFNHNIPQWREYLGFNQISETYTWDVAHDVLSIYGVVTKDNRQHVGDYTFTYNMNTKEMSYVSRYDQRGYDITFRYNFAAEESSLHFGIVNDAATILMYDYLKTESQFAQRTVNNWIGTKFDISQKLLKQSDGGLYNLTTTIDGIKRQAILTQSAFERESLSGTSWDLSYVEDSIYTLKASLDTGKAERYSAGLLDFSMTNKRAMANYPKKVAFLASYNPESSVFQITYGGKRLAIQSDLRKTSDSFDLDWNFSNIRFNLPNAMPQDISYTLSLTPTQTQSDLTVDNINVAALRRSPAHYSLVINDRSGTKSFDLSGEYSFADKKTISGTLVVVPLDFSYSVSGSVDMFKANTGNSTLTLSIVDNNLSKELDLIAYAAPTGKHAANFKAAISTTSSLMFVPFTLSTQYISDWDSESKIYNNDVDMTFNGKSFTFEGNFTPTSFQVDAAQSFSATAPGGVTMQGSGMKAEDDRRSAELRIQWGENEQDSLLFMTNAKYGENAHDSSLYIVQPSGLLSVRKFGVGYELDYSQQQSLKYGSRVYCDDNAFSVNVSYSGVLPQIYGSHRLQVLIEQPFLLLIPKQFTTTGVITLFSTGQYNSDWRITSENEELVTLVKNFIPTETGCSVDLLWKQSYFLNVPLHYVNVNASCDRTETSLYRAARIQIDDMPVTSGMLELSSDSSSDRSNKSLAYHFTSGALAPYLKFRDAVGQLWLKLETDERVSSPAYSLTFTVDGRTVHVDSANSLLRSRRTSRFETEMNLNHPFDLVLFGKSIPNMHSFSLNLLSRNKGSRWVVSYENDRMLHPLKMSNSYRLNSGDVVFEASSNIKFGPEEADDDVILRMNVANDDHGFDHVITMSMQYPEAKMNGDIVLGGVNNNNNIGFNVLAKDYSEEEVKTWEMRLRYKKTTNIITLYLNSPDMEETTLSGDLSQVLAQGKQLMQRLASDATNVELRFVKGIEKTDDGYDMYIGYDVQGESTCTLHLVVGISGQDAFASLQTKRDFVMEMEVARVAAVLVDSRLIQLRMSASPTVVKFFQKAISKMDAEFSRKVNWLADNLVQFLEAFKTVVTGNDEVELRARERIDQLVAKINAHRELILSHMKRLALGGSNSFDESGSILASKVRSGLTTMLGMVDKLLSIATQPITDLRDRYIDAFLRQVNTALLARLDPVVTCLRYANAEELFIELVKEATQKTAAYLMKNGDICLSLVRGPLSELLVVTDTEVIFNIPLQFDVDHLEPLPTLDDIKKWLAQSALAIKIDDAVSVVYSYADEYYKARSLLYLPADERLPPFKGHAFMSGFRHFSTFDKRHYHFSSGCDTSHVLVSDMRDNNFTVAVSYVDPSARTALNSIEVIVGSQKVNVFSDYKVQVNGRVTQLPKQLDELSVMLEGTEVHVRDVKGDIDVACDFNKDLCSVDISPFYFGSTAGLAGIYNNEPMDDFTGPSHDKLDDAQAFAASWEVSDTLCTTNNTYRPCDSNRISRICSSLFEDLSSPLRACFPIIHPEAFMEMCRDDTCDADDDKKSCTAVSAYAHRCKLAGAPLPMPDHCVVCSDTNGEMYDASASRNMAVAGLDVVFVVEQGQCWSQGKLIKPIRKFMKQLGSSLSRARIRKNRFHVVGYGGASAFADPHSHTFRSQAFTKKKNNVVKMLKKMSVNLEAAHADSLSAISYASQLPFRAGAKPVIILIPCGGCDTDSKMSYSDVEWKLRKQGVLFHHMQPESISAGSRSKTIYGFDDTTTFSSAADASSSSIKQSKSDVCVRLATDTGGSVWDANLLSKPAFDLKLSEYIVQRARSRTDMICSCKMNDAGVPSSVCTP